MGAAEAGARRWPNRPQDNLQIEGKVEGKGERRFERKFVRRFVRKVVRWPPPPIRWRRGSPSPPATCPGVKPKAASEAATTRWSAS